MSDAVIIGAGYVGQRLASVLKKRGERVFITTRSRKDASDAHLLDLDQSIDPADLTWLPAGARIIYLVPPPPIGEVDQRFDCFLSALSGCAPSRLVYVSTTAVYGNCGGGWVDEQCPTRPNTKRGKRRLNAENQLKHWCAERNISWAILRVAAIYGPGRLQLSAIEAQQAMIAAEQSPPGNRIHVDDLVQACVVVLNSNDNQQIFNVSDNNPIPRIEFCQLVAKHAQLPQPPAQSFDDYWQQASESQRSFLKGARKVDSRRLVEKLGVTLKYPKPEAGIVASLGEMLEMPKSA